MEKKEDQRVLLTKRLVHEAFLRLLGHKNIRQISVRELCESAGINRSTFYVHYGSLNDVLSELTNRYLSDIAKQIAETDARSRQDVSQRVALVLAYAEEHLELSRLLIDNNLDETFAARLFALPKIQDLLDTALSGMTEPGEKEDCITFIISGAYRLVQEWIRLTDRCTPEREAGRILTLARRVCGA